MRPPTSATPKLPALALLPMVLQAAPALQDEPAPGPTPGFTLPTSAAAAAWTAVPPDVEPAALRAAPWPAWPDAPAWSEAEPWDRWVERVAEEARASAPDAGRRAELALLAARQGRSRDAWGHFAACAGEPGVLASLIAPLALGLDPRTTAAASGLPAEPLPDDVLLRPILPPLTTAPEFGRPRVRGLEVRGLRVGEAVLDVKLSVELDGVELAFAHAGGGTARVRAVLPCPPDHEVRAVYVDWVRVEDPPEVLELEIRPGDEERALWGRFLPAATPWPGAVPDALSATLLAGGIAIEVDPEDPDRARLARFAASLGTLLGVPSGVVDGGAGPTHLRTVLRFPPDLAPAQREAKLAGMISLAERFALGGG